MRKMRVRTLRKMIVNSLVTVLSERVYRSDPEQAGAWGGARIDE